MRGLHSWPTNYNSEEEKVDAQAEDADGEVGDLQYEGEVGLERLGWFPGSSKIVDINLQVCQVLD